jgi:MtN3 and saliva related transmembrane protein
MNPSAVTLIRLLAAACTTIAFLPQVIHTIRTRDTNGISLLMYLLFTTGVGLWLIYGLIIHDLPLTLANLITLVLALIVLVLKLRHG